MLFAFALDDFWDEFLAWLPVLLGLLNLAVALFTIAWVLMTKSEATSATAWCLLIFFLPIVGAALFYLLGYQHVERPLHRKRRHKQRYKGQVERTSADAGESSANDPSVDGDQTAALHREMRRIAALAGAYPLTLGNRLEAFHEGPPAFDAMRTAIRQARHHIHLLTFIFQYDQLGREFLELLTAKAREGVEVRLLYDAMGSLRLSHRRLAGLVAAGGQALPFLPLHPLRRRMQINMRNHRKILVVDGQVGFIGGLNVGDEYLGKVTRFGFWRDTHLRLEGPVVADLQRIFAEDWDFAADEKLAAAKDSERLYFRPSRVDGDLALQVVDSGPDRDEKSIRELYFAAILKARNRVWIISPYFIPDPGLRDALRLAAQLGVDVRFLGQHHPDKWLAQYAARYYWGQVLPAGDKVYQYTKGMIHAKVVMVDGVWASVGTANLDNRSLYLNFEVNCLIYAPRVVADLEAAFLRDLDDAIRLDRHVYAGRLLENTCRLFSPVL